VRGVRVRIGTRNFFIGLALESEVG
jgi:hypothetical protein